MTMKLNEIAELVKKPLGTYVAAKLDTKSKNSIVELCEELNLTNRIQRDKMHTTIIYSRVYNKNVVADNSQYPMSATGKELKIFPTQDGKRALVLILDCPSMVKRHNDLMSEYELSYDYDKYNVHITLSYDVGDMNIDDIDVKLPNVTYVSEYVEDLILNWQNK